jgi:hypothetical protein
MVIVGSITGNTNTMAGNVPPKADLGDLSGLASGATMIDGKEFDGAKAYKDSKVCNVSTQGNHREGGRGICTSSAINGCALCLVLIAAADSGLGRLAPGPMLGCTPGPFPRLTPPSPDADHARV